MKKLPCLFAALLILPASLPAQSCVTAQYLAGFEGEPHDPVRSIPIHGSDGALYFTTNKGGWADDGAIVKLLPDGTRVTLVNFNRINKDRSPQVEPIGYLPETGVIEGPDGALYGTTEEGGNSTIGVSTVFRCTKAGAYTTLGYLPGGSAVTPTRLTAGSDGNFYGMTQFGSSGNGTVFRVAPNTPGNYTVCTISTIVQFTGPASTITATEGRYPRGPLAQRLDGGTNYMYGVLAESGATGSVTGRVFRFPVPSGPAAISPQNIGRLTSAGSLPEAGLTAGANGILYGTVSRSTNGGSNGGVYLIDASRNIMAIHDFGPDSGALGISPNSPVLYGSDGFLYGCNSGNAGHIWRMNSEGGEATRVLAFTGGVGGDGEDATGLVQRPDGSIWGLTAAGGLEGRGTLFSLTGSDRSWTHSVVWRMGLRVVAQEGANPAGGFVSDGTLLYGTTEKGGSLGNNGNGYGTIYSWNPATGQKTTLFPFMNDATAPGYWPRATLLRRADGNFYGTTSNGGAAPFVGGTLFRWKPASAGNPAQFATLAHFNGAAASGSFPAGAQPESPLVDGGDGWLYGTTTNGGAGGFGTLYRISLTTSAVQTLVQFTGAGGAKPGRNPIGGLVKFTAQGQTLLWGTTFYGSSGASNQGTLYSYDPVSGTFTSRVDFVDTLLPGYGPSGTLLARKGLLYGTCKFGGSGGLGTVWTYQPSGNAMTVIRAFNTTGIARHAGYPLAGLTLGPDGALYGTASESFGHNQPGSYGNLYRLSPTNEYSVAGTFTGFAAPLSPPLPGSNPLQGALCMGPDGMLYGTTANGGGGYGGIFRINPGPLVTTGTPQVTSMSSVTASAFVNPNGTPVSRSLEVISTAALSTGGTPSRMTLFAPDTSVPGSFSLNFTGLTANTDYAVRGVAGNAPCGDVFGEWVVFRINARTLWQGQQFGGSTGNGALDNDPDKDGRSNLHEWLMNTNPLRFDAGTISLAVLPVLPGQLYMDAHYKYSLARPLAGDEWVQFEISNDLNRWFPNGPAFDAGITTTPALYQVFSRENLPARPTFFRTRSGIKGTERIPTLYNTGVYDTRQTLPDNYVDPHWEAGAFIGGAWQGYGFAYHRNSQFGFPVYPAGPWYGDNSTSGWLGYTPTLAGGTGNTYVYRTTFNIPWGLDPRTVAISGRFTSDNQMYYMALNADTAVNGSAQTFITGDGNYSQFGPEWVLTRGFKTGNNTLEFHVEDGGSPSGFRAELTGTMQRAGRVAIPGLFNSGCTSLEGGPLLTTGQAVPGMKVFFPGQTTSATPVVHSSSGGWPVASGGWFSETYASTWIKPDNNASHAAGMYRYVLEFDLTGLDPNTVEIAGRFAADDSVTIFLNNVAEFNTSPVNYTGWTSFEMNSTLRSRLNPGINTLYFYVTNGVFAGTNPSGLRYEFLHGAAEPLPE